MNPILSKIGDWEITSTFEDRLNEMASEYGIGYFTAEADHDTKGVFLRLKVAAMVDTAGEAAFLNDPALNSVDIEFPEGILTWKVEDVVPVSGMEIEVVYRPLDKIKKLA